MGSKNKGTTSARAKSQLKHYERKQMKAEVLTGDFFLHLKVQMHQLSSIQQLSWAATN